MNLRDRARGQTCYIRFHGCSHDPDKTCLAHIRRGNVAGVGQKPSDLCALPLDQHCHDIVDGRKDIGLTRAEIDAELLRGLVQWLAWLDKNGKIKVV